MARPTPPPPSNDPDDIPNLVGLEGVVTYAAELGITITKWYVKAAVGRGELRHFLIRHQRHFTRADVRAWLLSLEA